MANTELTKVTFPSGDYIDLSGKVSKTGDTMTGNLTAPKFIGTLDEANLTWGGKNFSAGYGCIDAALMDELGANRFQFIKASAITVEYSRDGGTTWTDYGATDAQKKQIFAQGGSLIIGKADNTNKATEHPGLYQLRITIDTGVAGVYTVLNKFVIYVTTNGSANCMCKIQKALQSTPTTFIDHTDWIPIGGWSGYNVLNTSSLTTYGNTASTQNGRVRFIFKDGTGGSTSYNGLIIAQIKGFGGVGWSTPSTMAKTGHIYSYNENQDAIFSNMVQANYLKATTKMTVSSGKITQLTSGHTMLFADGIGISNPTTSNDVGWIRVLGTGESDTIMEIATGDDGGAGEQIVVRQYNTSSAITNEATLLDKSGNTKFPKKVIVPQVEGRITELGNYFNIGGGSNNRQSSADIPSDNNGGLRTFLATGSMTVGKPKTGDGHIVHFDWDNSNLWAAQIAIANGSGLIEHRGQNSDGTWGVWYKVYSEYNKPTWSDITSKPSTYAPTIGTTATTAMAGNTNVNNVMQTATTDEFNMYEMLFSYTPDDNTTCSEGARKASSILVNPGSSMLRVANISGGSSTVDLVADFNPYAYVCNSSSAIGLKVKADDIILDDGTASGTTNNWDGTNTSLKTAVTNKLDKSGGTITGNITLSDATIITPGSTAYGIRPATADKGFVGTSSYPFGYVTAGNLKALTLGNNNSWNCMTMSSNDITFTADYYSTADTWDGTNTSLKSALRNKISDIKIIKVNVLCTSLTKNMSLATYVTSSLPSGYTFLGWQSCGCTNGWVSTFPFYLANVLSSTGSPWWEGALNTNTGCGVDFYYFAIKK